MKISRITARSTQITSYGTPEVLKFCDVPLAPLLPTEIRIKTRYAAINYTDLEIRSGNWPVQKPNPFPYTPGVEVVGAIEEIGVAVRGWLLGQLVITMMQGLGGVRAERPGGYAEFVTVDAENIALLPETVNSEQVAALGLAGVTAYLGLNKIGTLAGKSILVTGGAGGVGSAAISIARALGATVVALITRDEHYDYVRSQGASEVIVSPRHDLPNLEIESVDGVLDVVGGKSFKACVKALRPGGVLSLVGAVAGGDVDFDAWQLLRPITLTGFSTETLDGTTFRDAIAVLSEMLAAGQIRPPTHQLIPLADASRAHTLIHEGKAKGRVLLVP
jgi:NADPH:quinone reductase-like Zn-dependent oxidoreductase